jgi:hypothetical protein
VTDHATTFRYVDTAVNGLSNRNVVVSVDEFTPVAGTNESYMTWCRYPMEFVVHTVEAASVAGYSGAAWATFVPIDIDVPDDLPEALEQARRLVRYLVEVWEIDGLRIFFSGSKGFALEIPSALFGGFEPCIDLHQRVGRLVAELIAASGVSGVDPDMYTALRLWRSPNTRNAKSGLFKIPLTMHELLTLDIDAIKELAASPRIIEQPDDDDWLPRRELVALWERTASGRFDDFAFKEPLDVAATMLGVERGSRNTTGWRLACRNRADGVPRERAEGMACEFAGKCRPPLPRKVALDQVARAYRLYEPNPRIVVSGGSPPQEAEWPTPPDGAAFHGVAGQIVQMIEPHTEADPVALLLNLLTGFGVATGPNPHAMVGATRHSPRLFTVLLGKTGRARKGDSWTPVERVLRLADPLRPMSILGGLSSGEGLITAVRDPRTEWKPERGSGEIREVVVDRGVEDKRLLVIEPEFARVLETMSRSGSTLNAIVRDAWDGRDLRSMTKTPLVATRPHIALIAHITPHELRVKLTETDAANGFGNRHVFAAVRRARELPNPQAFDDRAASPLADLLKPALMFARSQTLIGRNESADELWCAMYHDLTTDHPGLSGSMMARAEAHVLRLSLIYALLDRSSVVQIVHLAAAAALWDYCQRTLWYVFGDATGDPIADRIATTLKADSELNRTQIDRLFSGHARADKIDRAGQLLTSLGRITVEHIATDGRPAEVWRWCATYSAFPASSADVPR